jgi:1-acyl-sn-glycerol-3-phosphate acyltransferase
MAAALGLANAPPWAQRLARAAFALPSWPVARVLARFDRRIAEAGIDVAASETLSRFGARWHVDGRVSQAGPLLALSNHPGAYDALALMAALGRRDLRILAADRRFLRAMPNLAQHLLLVPDEAGSDSSARAAGARRAARHLRGGGALLHFPAGEIEPDPAFLRPGEEALGPWRPGIGLLLRAAAAAEGRVVVVVVAGVHSRRAKRLLITRLAERRGVTTLAPLIQAALPGFRDVDVRVRVGDARDARELDARDDAQVTARMRREAGALAAGR